jgi:hypothetical protein
MFPDQVEDWRQIAAEIKRRRRREYVAGVPAIGAVLLIIQLLHDANFELGGLGGLPLLATAFAILAAYAVHHLSNWRCPACKHYLGKLGASLCGRCGATFTAPKDQPLMDDGAARKEQERRAVAAEVAQYRNKTGMGLLRGLVVVVLGGVMVLLAQSPETVKPDSVLVRRFGPGGAHLATQLFGGIVVVIGCALIAYAIWRHRTGVRRYGDQLRSLVDARGGAAPPSQ